MSDDRMVEERVRRTFAQVAARTVITSRSVPPIDLDHRNAHTTRRPTTRAKVAVATFASLAVVGGVAWVVRGTPHRIDVLGGSSSSGPSTSTTTSSTPSCPLSGVAPNGHTYGTVPGPTSTAPTPEFIAVSRSADLVHPPANRDDAHQVLGYERLGAGLPTPVYACDLTTVVGHIYENKGYLPLGVNPETVPTFPHPVTNNALGLVVDGKIAVIEMVWAEGGSPLAASLTRVGLGVGETITSVDGTPVTSGSSLNAATAGVHPGDQVQVSWTDKAGQQHTATVQT